MEKKTNSCVVNGAVVSAESLNNQQWTKYHTRGGHGFAAEDANAMSDIFSCKHVEKVGMDNSLDGADRISGGVSIQTKYYCTAKQSVDAAFRNGQYRYEGMKLEVPSDQYEEAVRHFADLTDLQTARQTVIKGSVTYKEACNIAKTGNLDSITFDVKTHSVACGVTCGLSFVVSYAKAIHDGKTHSEAIKEACKASAKAGLITMSVGVATQQFLRTSIGRSTAAVVTHAIRPAVTTAMSTSVGRSVLTPVASAMAGKQVAGAAARNVLTAGARANVIVGAGLSAVAIGSNIHKCCKGEMSTGECVKESVADVAGIGGGMAGFSAGAAVGSLIPIPVVGTLAGGLIGGTIGTIASSSAVKGFFGLFK